MLIRLVVLAMIAATLRIGGCAERLFYLPTAGSVTPPPRVDVLEFNTPRDDGVLVHGWFLPSTQHDDPRDAATVIYCHGNAGNLESHVAFVEHLPKRGFNVVLFDYRGYGQTPGRAWRRRGLIEDARVVVDHVLARDDIDPTRVGLYGQSLGGSIGLNVMTTVPAIRAAVLESPFDSWRTVAANAVAGDPPGWWGRGLAWWLIPDHARPIDAVARIDRPLLFIHGDADRVIPVSHSRRLAAAAPDAELLIGPGGEHNSLRFTHPELDEAMIAFFERTLDRQVDSRSRP